MDHFNIRLKYKSKPLIKYNNKMKVDTWKTTMYLPFCYDKIQKR